jgi:4-diphosphocytidyl-2-C-methyl-D-erythritol kinase
MTILLAPAKINLWLSVGPSSGELHEISSVMQSVSLFDEISIEASDRSEVAFEWAEGLEGELPKPPDLIARVMERLDGLGDTGHHRARAIKRIPLSGGLGGGSSDAAAVIRHLGGLVGDDASMRVANELGSDVSFCLAGGTAIVTGKGDLVTPLNGVPEMWWVLGITDEGLSTEHVYARFDELREPRLEDPKAIVDALRDGDLSQVGLALSNDLQAAAIDLMPAVEGRLDAMRKAGALGAIVSGSGPTVLGLASSEAHAHQVGATVRGVFDRVEAVSSLPAEGR